MAAEQRPMTARPTLSELRDELATVPSYDAFLTVDQMSRTMRQIAEHSEGRCRLQQVGTSAGGETILELVIDGGDRNAVVFGFPHPNEPVGGLTALHLARRLTDDEALCERLGTTWHIVVCADPDGARLNEAWFAEHGSRTAYTNGFYRPPGRLQVEWTFPFSYEGFSFDAPVPETCALIDLFDRTEPDLLVALHNSESGGVYYYLSEPQPELYDVLAQLPGEAGLPLDVGEPEAPWIPQLAPGIYEALPMEKNFAAIVAAHDGKAPDTGMSSTDYCRRYGTFGLVCEVPQWLDRRSADTALTDQRYNDLLRRQAGLYRVGADAVLDIIESVDDQIVESPLSVAAREFRDDMESEATSARRRADQPENDRDATVAEVASVPGAAHALRCRIAAMLVRALEVSIGQDSSITLAAAHSRAVELRDRWVTEAAEDAQEDPAPIGALVRVQFGAILAAASSVTGTPSRMADRHH